MLKSIYLQQVYSDLAARDPEQKEFHQAVREVLESLDLMIDSHPEYREAALLERFVEPERVVAFRVPWMDDTGRIRVNRGYRVQFMGFCVHCRRLPGLLLPRLGGGCGPGVHGVLPHSAGE